MSGVKIVQHHDLIADQPRAAVDRLGGNAPDIRVALGSTDREPAALMQRAKPREIQIPPVHHMANSGLEDQNVEDVDIVPFAVGNKNETGDCTAKIQRHVQLDRSLG
jgi:hypothetical protein